jgi:hypothetical protein
MSRAIAAIDIFEGVALDLDVRLIARGLQGGNKLRRNFVVVEVRVCRIAIRKAYHGRQS